jgi:signal peptidase II
VSDTLRSPAAWFCLLLPLSVVLLVDLTSKRWAFATVAGRPVTLVREQIVDNLDYRLPPHEGVRVIPFDLLDFHLVLNHGAVFGIGDGQRWIFILFTIMASAAGVWAFARMTGPREHWAHLGLGLVLAGGLGNLYDRIVFGAVRDFLHMLPRWHLPFGWRWPGGGAEVFPWVFNVADVSLLAGMGVLLVMLGRHRGEPGAAASGRD